MVSKIEKVKFAYVGGNSHAFDNFKIRTGKSLITGEKVFFFHSYELVLRDRLYVWEDDEQVAHTSQVVATCWEENIAVDGEQYALAKCFETASGSKYYFVPVNMLS